MISVANLLKARYTLTIFLCIEGGTLMGQQPKEVESQQLVFKDDGAIPNNTLPLLLYREAFAANTKDLASVIEQRFAENDWTGSWRAGVYPFPHYHSTTHEVLGVFAGSATLRLGGAQGTTVKVGPGDVIVIPAGVGHQNFGSSADFSVVGAYPGGRCPAWMATQPPSPYSPPPGPAYDNADFDEALILSHGNGTHLPNSDFPIFDPDVFYSYHAMGANFLFGDGSVHFLGSGINPQTYQYLCTIAGGERLPEDW